MLQKPINYSGIDRDVPRKVALMGKETYCPRCHAMVAKLFHPKFCGECGQKLSYQEDTEQKKRIKTRSDKVIDKFFKEHKNPIRRKR